jgi:hypothetical protein
VLVDCDLYPDFHARTDSFVKHGVDGDRQAVFGHVGGLTVPTSRSHRSGSDPRIIEEMTVAARPSTQRGVVTQM